MEGTVSGSPPFEISCLHNEKLLRNNTVRHMSVENNTVTLHICGCESRDAGTYQVTVSNDVGEVTCSCQVSLKGQFRRSFYLCMCSDCSAADEDPAVCVCVMCDPLPLEPPLFLESPEDVLCTVGSDVSLRCLLSGALPMSFSWSRDDHELSEDEHMKTCSEMRSTALNLRNAQLSHAGTYVCEAQNKAGTQRCSALLVVTGW